MLHPAIWPYLILLMALTACWITILYLGWKPAQLLTHLDTPAAKLGWLLLPPLLATGALFALHDGVKAISYRNWVKLQEAKAQESRQQAQAAADEQRFALEVLGSGRRRRLHRRRMV